MLQPETVSYHVIFTSVPDSDFLACLELDMTIGNVYHALETACRIGLAEGRLHQEDCAIPDNPDDCQHSEPAIEMTLFRRTNNDAVLLKQDRL